MKILSVDEGTAMNQPANPVAQSVCQLAPLVVDLDGTLVKTDLLTESVMALLRKQPWYLFILPAWIMRGKARFKQQVARRVSLDAGTLPWRVEFVDYLRRQRAEGRSVLLATGSNMRITRDSILRPVAARLVDCRHGPALALDSNSSSTGPFMRYSE